MSVESRRRVECTASAKIQSVAWDMLCDEASERAAANMCPRASKFGVECLFNRLLLGRSGLIRSLVFICYRDGTPLNSNLALRMNNGGQISKQTLDRELSCKPHVTDRCGFYWVAAPDLSY